MKFINYAEGYLQPNGIGGFDYVYQNKDHLGNIRLSYSDRNHDGQISDTPIFEDNFESASGWESQGSLHGAAVDAYDDSFSHSGNYAARIDTPEGDAKYVHSNTWVTIDNEQATAYTYFGWAYSDGPGIRVMLFMNEEAETDYYTQLDVFSDYETTNQWVYFEKTVMVPANIKRLNIRIESFWMAPGHVWFDDIQIKGQGSEIVEENHYYPFGLKHRGYNNVVNGVENKYQTYQGQEKEEYLGKNTYAFQWRDYDPAIARFNKIDRFAEKYENATPYHFSANNPIFFREIKGDSINVAELYKKDRDGNYVNAKQVKAFEAFAGTKAGKKYLSKFASKGQKIAGIEFDKDGKYHKDKIDLNLGAKPTDKSADGTTGLSKDDNGRWQFDVNFKSGKGDLYENTQALTHELFVHVDNYIPDIYDDGRKNHSNMPNWINQKFSPRQRHHQYERYLSRTDRSSSIWLTQGFNIMQIINNQTKRRTYEEVWYDLFDGL